MGAPFAARQFAFDGLKHEIAEGGMVGLHMAAQALVRKSYITPVDTFTTNVIGTVSLLDSIRESNTVKAVVIVTSDKVYENKETLRGYSETDQLGGYDPYSASKGCTEVATNAMRRSFFGKDKHPARIATVRAGNVIGGGDWSEDRLVPDIIRGCLSDEGLVTLRSPNALRPWQHVLDPLSAYLRIAELLYKTEKGYDEAWNIGPDDAETHPVVDRSEEHTSELQSLVNLVCRLLLEKKKIL